MTEAGGVLAISVTLLDPQFKLATFPVGSTPPAWAQAQITNPKAWASAPEGLADEVPEASVAEPERASITEPEEDLVGELPEPPKRGPGSGRDAWVAYADSRGVKYDSDAHRDDIIAAVEAAE